MQIDSLTIHLTRSKRKTIAIYIRDGGVEVRAPLKMPKCDVDKFVVSKKKWIEDKLAQSRECLEKSSVFMLNYGDTVMLRGTEYPLVARAGTKAGFDGEVFYLPPDLAPAQIKPVIVQIYRRIAKIHITKRAACFSAHMGAAPAAVKINGAKASWGSCSSKKSLNFSWRLIMADDAVIDYVVVHELAHISEMNHSARFWAIVAGFLPDYKARQAKLKELQQRLSGENWN